MAEKFVMVDDMRLFFGRIAATLAATMMNRSHDNAVEIKNPPDPWYDPMFGIQGIRRIRYCRTAKQRRAHSNRLHHARRAKIRKRRMMP